MAFGNRRGEHKIWAEIKLARDQDVESFAADRAVSTGLVSFNQNAFSPARILISRTEERRNGRNSPRK